VRRTQIVEAAAKVLDHRDPNDVTFEEIAEAAGVSRALVYNHFGDRGGLLAAVYVHTFDQLDDMLNESVAADADPVGRLRDIIRRYLHFADDNAAAWRLLHVTSTMDHPAVRGARRRHMEQLGAAWGAEGPEARIIAYAIVGMLESATVEWLIERDADVDRLAGILFDLMWTGLSSLGPHGIQVPAARQQYHAATVR
jgi:AcrR family transcriptional regulator